jgi:hypothetical protein
MSNTLTSLTPDLYEALDVVSRELVGMIPAVSRDSSVERAALNQTVRSFVTNSASSSNINPGQLPPDDGNQTVDNHTIAITKSKYVPIRWAGEEQRAMNANGPGYSNILRDQFAQAMRTLCNEIEADLASQYIYASRAISPSDTTLFKNQDYKDLANVRKVLVDNGAPLGDMHAILSTTAGAQFRGNAQYLGANTAGNETMLRQGVLLDMHGMSLRESAQVKHHTKGTGSGLKTDSTGYAVGATSIVVATDGSGTIVAGDIITFSGDATASQYVVTSGGDMSSGGTVVIAAPGLRGSLDASQSDIAIIDKAERNCVFTRNAIHLVTRAPARPQEGDLAVDVMTVQDPRSGLGFEVAMYKEYRRVKFEVAAAWGYSVIKPEHFALLVE